MSSTVRSVKVPNDVTLDKALSTFNVTLPEAPPPFNPVPAQTHVIVPVPVQVVYPQSFVHCDILPPLLVKV